MHFKKVMIVIRLLVGFLFGAVLCNAQDVSSERSRFFYKNADGKIMSESQVDSAMAAMKPTADKLGMILTKRLSNKIEKGDSVFYDVSFQVADRKTTRYLLKQEKEAGLVKRPIGNQVEKFTDWENAKEKATLVNKDILIILTGDEWCKPCVRLEKNVISQPDFIDFANVNLVIFEINLPRSIDIHSKVAKDYNSFKTTYKTNSLPSLILVDKNGIEKTRITSGGATLENVIRRLKERI